jgi:hypothetical protein
VGLYLARVIPEMRSGPHSERIPSMYFTVKALLDESVMELPVEDIETVTVKNLYMSFTETLPPPKVMYKQNQGRVWENVWSNINHPMLRVKEREFLFLLVHNILPTRERLFKMNLVESEICVCGGGAESLEHIFFTCVKSQSAWSWMRRKMETVVAGARLYSFRDFLKMDFKSKTFLFFMNFYFSFVWRKLKTENIAVINIVNMEADLKSEFYLFQRSQNRFDTLVI